MYLLSPPFHFQSYRLSISLPVDVTRDISTQRVPIITEAESRESINFPEIQFLEKFIGNERRRQIFRNC